MATYGFSRTGATGRRSIRRHSTCSTCRRSDRLSTTCRRSDCLSATCRRSDCRRSDRLSATCRRSDRNSATPTPTRCCCCCRSTAPPASATCCLSTRAGRGWCGSRGGCFAMAAPLCRRCQSPPARPSSPIRDGTRERRSPSECTRPWCERSRPRDGRGGT